MNRPLAALLCLLYASVSTIFAAAHFHGKEHGSTQCHTCVWQKTASIDLPATGNLVVEPVFHMVAFREQPTAPVLIFLAPSPSRGPPSFLS